MVIVNPRVESGVSAELLAQLRLIAPATIGHLLEHEFMDPELRPVISDFAFAGPAITVRCFGTDNAIVHYAVDIAQPGDVVVVDRLGDRRYACWGGGVSLGAHVKGIAGAVVDGVLTDRKEILELKFPVFGRGISPLTTRSPGRTGELNVAVRCGGIIVNPGDIVLADDDGIVVLPPARVAEIVAICLPREEQARARQQRMRDGVPLGELSGAHQRIDDALRQQR
ncbi:MAG: RraA family protein [Chloroflexi bacterium]|nr:RraA family protein [Chloroflexota bacterium]MBV9602279.1 RraA family protein [Chloroflexota bacterium]